MKVTTKIRLDLNEHPFAEGESLVGYAERHALLLGIPGSLQNVKAGIDRTTATRQSGAVCQGFIDEEWIEMEFERIGPPEPEVVLTHIIEFSDGGWAIEHVPGCRVGGSRLLDCEVHTAVTDAAARWIKRPVDVDGRYVISFALDTGEPEFTILDDDDV